jgi:hypothetical protein
MRRPYPPQAYPPAAPPAYPLPPSTNPSSTYAPSNPPTGPQAGSVTVQPGQENMGGLSFDITPLTVGVDRRTAGRHGWRIHSELAASWRAGPTSTSSRQDSRRGVTRRCRQTWTSSPVRSFHTRAHCRRQAHRNWSRPAVASSDGIGRPGGRGEVPRRSCGHH